MKLDGEAPHHQPSSHQLASKVIGHNDSPLTVNVLFEGNEAEWEGKDDLIQPAEKKSCKDTDPSQCKGSDDPTIGNQDNGEFMEAPFSLLAGNIGLVKKETKLYTDKTVAEIERPEIVCFRDGACHVVKDICIDEGSNTLEKFLIENVQVGQKFSSTFNHSATNGNSVLFKETTDDASSKTHDLNSMLVDGHPISVFDRDAEEQHSSWTSVNVRDKLDKTYHILSDISDEKIKLKQVFPVEEIKTNPWQVDLISFDCVDDHKQSIQSHKLDQDILEERSFGTIDDAQPGTREHYQDGRMEENPADASLQRASSEECSTSIALSSDVEESKENAGSKEKPANAEVENAANAVPNPDLNSGAGIIISSEEGKENTDNQQSGQARKDPISDEAVFDGAPTSARSSSVHQNHGDLNFSGRFYLSGPVASSGHIPYSGSISHRSDSSTTSTRSFAFPILQTEWNSSPVKMAKADRRRLRKHRGWRMGLLCCRF